MNAHILDILSIMLVVSIASIYLLKTFVNMRNKKCGTICSGCSSTKSCSTKSFVKQPTTRPIHFKPRASS